MKLRNTKSPTPITPSFWVTAIMGIPRRWASRLTASAWTIGPTTPNTFSRSSSCSARSVRPASDCVSFTDTLTNGPPAALCMLAASSTPRRAFWPIDW